MKKKIVAIMACAMMLLSAGASAEMTAGTYTGEGQGIGGAVKVAVTVEGGAITAVEVVEHAETAGICDPAIEKIPAAIVAAQSLAVDTVTGATVTSKAILAAAEQALTEAGVKIYEYLPGFIHSKVCLSAARYAVVGTVNMDFRSL